jgi:hypothetical protein
LIIDSESGRIYSGFGGNEISRKEIRVMNEKQKRIYDWLKGLESNLSELYWGATKLIEDKTFPGRERFICHAVREIRNRLPEAVAGEGILKRFDYTKEIEELANAYERAGLGGVRIKDGDEQGVEQKIPQEIMVRLNSLVSEHRAVAQRNRENVTKLLIALEPENKSMQSSLRPIAGQWMRETEWFVGRAHEGEKARVEEEELVERFAKFENTLYALCGYFYDGMDRIEDLIRKANEGQNIPGEEEIDQIVSQLVKVKYQTHFFDKLENPYWIAPLNGRKFFESPTDPESSEAYERWPQGWYLKKMAAKAPKDILGVIKGIRSRNPYVRNLCIECLLEMPIERAACGIEVIKNIFSSREREGDFGWAWMGEQAAKLMVKLVERNQDAAFKIAWLLLDAWVPNEKERRYGDYIVSKFSEHDYKELMLEYYSKVWEVEPARGVGVLMIILNRCLGDLDKEGKGEEGYDASRHFGYGLELGDLNEIDMKHPGIKTILVKGICEGGKVLIDKEPGKGSKLLDLLERTHRVIYLRIAMYLMRFVKHGKESERISRLIGNKDCFREYNPYWYEHRRLLNDKFEDVSDEVKKAFLEWVNEDKYSEDHRREIIERCKKNNEAEPDFEKWENYAKAEELYLVRERFKDEYERYKKAAVVKNDSELAPRKKVSEAHFVSPEEGSTYSSEKMGKDGIESVINYLLEPRHYEGKENVSGWGTAKDAIAASFGADIRKRPMEYLNVDLKKLESLDPEFLDRLFSGISGAVRDGSFKKEGWERLIDLAGGIVEEKKKEKEWRECFLAILWVLHDGFVEESNRITFNETIIRKFWLILKILVGYNYDEKSESEDDPVQQQLRSVQGRAFEQIVLLGVVCKNHFAAVYEDYMKKEMVQVYEFVTKAVKRSEVNCTLGFDFARIYWLDKEWVESNTEIIFDNAMWDAVWGTYVSWGRPSPQCFKYLVEKGIYGRAVERIGEKSKYKFRKEPDEGLVEHLMIGCFNGWVDFESDVLKKFFEKASAELRGKAAEFLTTGFKSVKEEGKPYEEIAERMRTYWKGRLAVIKGNPTENEKEAIEFTGWVEDSLLPAKETMELLEQSLDVSGGIIGEMRDARKFVEGISKLGKGNEALALRCLKKAAADKNMHLPWARIQEPLVKFLEELPDGMRSEGREVADLYGRYNPDKFRGVWEKLK